MVKKINYFLMWYEKLPVNIEEINENLYDEIRYRLLSELDRITIDLYNRKNKIKIGEFVIIVQDFSELLKKIEVLQRIILSFRFRQGSEKEEAYNTIRETLIAISNEL